VIQRIIRLNYYSFQECYEAGLSRNPKLSGRVNARFVIDRSGLVTNVTITKEGTTMPDEAVVSCVAAAFRHLTFPKPDGGIVSVVYPIYFEPSD
jgi:TonB family protein